MLVSIDLNCDLGEGCGNDAELMKYISSANIGCGGHAGDADTMRRTVELALENNVAIGAHPGFNDRANFGRLAVDISREEIVDLITEQVNSLAKICGELGANIRHVKPHGALYNQSAKDPEIAAAIAEAVKQIDGGLILFGLSGSHSISEAERIGLRTASEVFADRTYQSDGSLTPRNEPNALITDARASIEQVLNMTKYGRVRTTDSIMLSIVAETICIHGDGQHPIDFARSVNKALADKGFSVEGP